MSENIDKVVSIDGKSEDTDPFEDLDQLRMDQNFDELAGVKKQIITVPIRKPSRQDFIRVHPDESYHLATAILEVKEDRENYLILPEIRKDMPGEFVVKMLYTSINRQGVLFLWHVKLEDEMGRLDEWNRTAHRAARLAMKGWIRLASNRSLGAYDIFVPVGDLPDPEWPEIEFKEILNIAFKGKIIDNIEHKVVKRLLGAI